MEHPVEQFTQMSSFLDTISDNVKEDVIGHDKVTNEEDSKKHTCDIEEAESKCEDSNVTITDYKEEIHIENYKKRRNKDIPLSISRELYVSPTEEKLVWASFKHIIKTNYPDLINPSKKNTNS